MQEPTTKITTAKICEQTKSDGGAGAATPGGERRGRGVTTSRVQSGGGGGDGRRVDPNPSSFYRRADAAANKGPDKSNNEE
jgi:hypothetical protein